GVAPHRALHSEIIEAREATAREKARSDEADPTLDKRFVGGTTRTRRKDREAVPSRIVHEARVEERRVVFVAHYHRLHVVEDINRRASIEEGEASLHAT